MTEQAAPAEAPVRWLSDQEQRAWRAFLDMQSQLNGRLNRELQENSGLSIADFSVLVTLSEHPEHRIRVLELARGLRWEKSRLSHQLTRMQQRGLVERSTCSEDRRGAWVELTIEGRNAIEAAAPGHVASVRKYVFDDLTPELVTAMETIAQGTVDRLVEVCAGRPNECDAVDPESCG